MSIGGTCLTPEQAEIICERIADGRSIASIAKDDDMPASSTIYKALDGDKEFAENYARARERQADKFAAEIIEIADDGTRDIRVDDEGNEVVDHDHIARSRLRVDARKWAASKMAPKKYGDKIAVGGADDLPAMKSETHMVVSFVSAKERNDVS